MCIICEKKNIVNVEDLNCSNCSILTSIPIIKG